MRLADLAEAVHIATRAKTLGAAAAGEGLSAEERRRASSLAETLAVKIAPPTQMDPMADTEVRAFPSGASDEWDWTLP